MSKTQFITPKKLRPKTVLIGAGIATLSCTAIAMIGLHLKPIDPTGAVLGSTEFTAAADWIKANKAHYCDMSPEQTLLYLAKKPVPGLLTKEESIAHIIQATIELSVSTDPRQRAQGLYVHTLQLGGAAAPEIQQLVALAKSTNDSSVYATALAVCKDSKNEICTAVNAEKWAQIDTENGIAWLAAAQTALDRKDDESAKGAIEKAAAAKFFKSHTPTVAPLMSATAIKALPLYNREMVGLELMALPQISPMHQLSVIKYCVEKGIPRLERSTLCNDIATRLAKDDQTSEGLAVAASITKLFAWDKQRLAVIEAKKKSVATRAMDIAMSNALPYLPCADWVRNDSAYSRLLLFNPLVISEQELKANPAKPAEPTSK